MVITSGMNNGVIHLTARNAYLVVPTPPPKPDPLRHCVEQPRYASPHDSVRLLPEDLQEDSVRKDDVPGFVVDYDALIEHLVIR